MTIENYDVYVIHIKKALASPAAIDGGSPGGGVVRGGQAHKHADRSGLAGTVVAQQCEDLVLVHVEGEVVDRDL